jgi:hypothetical protein
MFCLYAITDGRPHLHVRGHGGAPLEAIRTSGIEAVASEHEELDLPADEDALWTHERVVEALMDQGAVLPMRFGSLLESDDEVRVLLANRVAEFRRALDRIRGAVEIGVRVALRGDADARAVPDARGSGAGTAYMLGQLERTRHHGSVEARVADALTPLAREHVSRANGSAGASLNSAYLVERDRLDDFVSRASELEGQLTGVRVACTGPWPAYSFANAEASR